MNTSPQRRNASLSAKGKTEYILKMCETSWVKRHEEVLTFLDILPWLPEILQKLADQDQGNRRSATPPFSLLQSIMSSEFLISLVILSDILGITVPLS